MPRLFCLASPAAQKSTDQSPCKCSSAECASAAVLSAAVPSAAVPSAAVPSAAKCRAAGVSRSAGCSSAGMQQCRDAAKCRGAEVPRCSQVPSAAVPSAGVPSAGVPPQKSLHRSTASGSGFGIENLPWSVTTCTPKYNRCCAGCRSAEIMRGRAEVPGDGESPGHDGRVQGSALVDG